MKDNEIILENAPPIAGLHYRKFEGKTDFPHMIAIIDAAAKADKEDRADTLEKIEYDYAHLTNCDPATDMIFAIIHHTPIAYGRVAWWQEEDPNHRIYSVINFTHPDWRNQGMEAAMISWCEARLMAVSKEHPQDGQRFFQTYGNENQPYLADLLAGLGYQPVRYFYEMNRPLENIPEPVLPEGIEARPVRQQDERKIWDASIEAFRDHWGFSEPLEEDYIAFKGSKEYNPELWQVAWEGDKVVGSVLNYIDHDYNRKFNRKCGWTEEISTRKPWRRRGIAKALIIRSMQMHKALGMTQVALGVDTDNPTGALKLYEILGYVKQKTMITYRKPMP